MASLVTADGTVLRRRGNTAGLTGIWGGSDRVRLSGDSRSVSYEAIYEGNPTCAAVVNKLRHQVATLPLKTYQLDDKGDRVLQRDHPVQHLLRFPAPRTPAARFKEWLIFPALVHGNGLVAKYRDPNGDGTPTGLLPLSWPYVSAYAQQGKPVEVWGTTQLGEQRYIPVEETIHLAWESGSCHGLGTSPLKQLASAIKLDDSMRRYQEASFDNGVRPSTAVVLPEGAKVGKVELEQMEAQISRLKGGVDNNAALMLLAGGATIETFSHTAVEAELMAARTLTREEIAMVYDVPPPMIGDLTHGTYSNVQELHSMLYVTTLRPWLKLIEETLQAQLIDPEPAWADDGIFVEFDLSEVLRGSPKEQLDALAAAFGAGLITLNEARKELNMPRLDDEMADKPFIPTNNQAPLNNGAPPPGTTPPLLA